MKETFYFSHDYNARLDDKIKLLLRKYGMVGYGIFWSIIEDLYNNANALRLDYEGIAFDLRVEKKTIEWIIKDSNLFEIKGDFFGSKSVERRLKERDEKSSKAKESAFKRWNKHAIALPMQCEGNAIKESKVNNIKENIKINSPIQEREKLFYSQIAEFTPKYSKEMLREFYNYWREPSKSGKKMKFEMEKTWSLSMRLEKWQNNADKFLKSPTKSTIQSKSLSDKKLD